MKDAYDDDDDDDDDDDERKSCVNTLPEVNAIVVVHDGPDVLKAAVVDGTFDEDRDNAGEHETDLYDVRPHHSFHAALQTTHRHRVSK